MKYNVKIYTPFNGRTMEDTDFYADTDHEAIIYVLILAQFKGYEEYVLTLGSEDKAFNLGCTGNRGTRIKV